MNNAPHSTVLTMNDATELVGALPALLGFTPSEEMVIVGMGDVSPMARTEIPSGPAAAARIVTEVGGTLVTQGVRQVAVITYANADLDVADVHAVVCGLEARGLDVAASVLVSGGRVRDADELAYVAGCEPRTTWLSRVAGLQPEALPVPDAAVGGGPLPDTPAARRFEDVVLSLLPGAPYELVGPDGTPPAACSVSVRERWLQHATDEDGAPWGRADLVELMSVLGLRGDFEEMWGTALAKTYVARLVNALLETPHPAEAAARAMSVARAAYVHAPDSGIAREAIALFALTSWVACSGCEPSVACAEAARRGLAHPGLTYVDEQIRAGLTFRVDDWRALTHP